MPSRRASRSKSYMHLNVSSYADLLKGEPLMAAISPFIMSMSTFFGEPTIRPPRAAPPMVTISDG